MSRSLAIFNFTPKYCPLCGKAVSVEPRQYQARVYFVCSIGCNLHFQLVDPARILDAARADGGDLE